MEQLTDAQLHSGDATVADTSHEDIDDTATNVITDDAHTDVVIGDATDSYNMSESIGLPAGNRADCFDEPVKPNTDRYAGETDSSIGEVFCKGDEVDRELASRLDRVASVLSAQASLEDVPVGLPVVVASTAFDGSGEEELNYHTGEVTRQTDDSCDFSDSDTQSNTDDRDADVESDLDSDNQYSQSSDLLLKSEVCLTDDTGPDASTLINEQQTGVDDSSNIVKTFEATDYCDYLVESPEGEIVDSASSDEVEHVHDILTDENKTDVASIPVEESETVDIVDIPADENEPEDVDTIPIVESETDETGDISIAESDTIPIVESETEDTGDIPVTESETEGIVDIPDSESEAEDIDNIPIVVCETENIIDISAGDLETKNIDDNSVSESETEGIVDIPDSESETEVVDTIPIAESEPENVVDISADDLETEGIVDIPVNESEIEVVDDISVVEGKTESIVDSPAVEIKTEEVDGTSVQRETVDDDKENDTVDNSEIKPIGNIDNISADKSETEEIDDQTDTVDNIVVHPTEDINFISAGESDIVEEIPTCKTEGFTEDITVVCIDDDNDHDVRPDEAGNADTYVDVASTDDIPITVDENTDKKSGDISEVNVNSINDQYSSDNLSDSEDIVNTSAVDSDMMDDKIVVSVDQTDDKSQGISDDMSDVEADNERQNDITADSSDDADLHLTEGSDDEQDVGSKEQESSVDIASASDVAMIEPHENEDPLLKSISGLRDFLSADQTTDVTATENQCDSAVSRDTYAQPCDHNDLTEDTLQAAAKCLKLAEGLVADVIADAMEVIRKADIKIDQEKMSVEPEIPDYDNVQLIADHLQTDTKVDQETSVEPAIPDYDNLQVNVSSADKLELLGESTVKSAVKVSDDKPPVKVGVSDYDNITSTVEVVSKGTESKEVFRSREPSPKVSQKDVKEAVLKLKQRSKSADRRAPRPRSYHAEGQRMRHYDWNTHHFFPDIHDFGYVPRRRASYGYVDEEWVRDLYYYNRLQAEQLAADEAAASVPLSPDVATEDRREILRENRQKIVSPSHRIARRSRSAGREQFLRDLVTSSRTVPPPPRVPSPEPKEEKALSHDDDHTVGSLVYVTQLHSYRGADRESDVVSHSRRRGRSECSDEPEEKATAATRPSRHSRHQEMKSQYDQVDEEDGKQKVDKADFYVPSVDSRKQAQLRRDFSSSFENIYDGINGDVKDRISSVPSTSENKEVNKSPEPRIRTAEYYISAENYSGHYRQPPAKPRRQPVVVDAPKISPKQTAAPVKESMEQRKTKEQSISSRSSGETYGKFYYACGYKTDNVKSDDKKTKPVENDKKKDGHLPDQWGVKNLIDEERQSYMSYKQAYELDRSNQWDKSVPFGSHPQQSFIKQDVTVKNKSVDPTPDDDHRRAADSYGSTKALLPTTEDYEYVLKKVYPAISKAAPQHRRDVNKEYASRGDSGPSMMPPRPASFDDYQQAGRERPSFSRYERQSPRVKAGSYDGLHVELDQELASAGVYLTPSPSDLSPRSPYQLGQREFEIQNEKQYAQIEHAKNINMLDVVLDEMPGRQVKASKSDSELESQIIGKIGVDLISGVPDMQNRQSPQKWNRHGYWKPEMADHHRTDQVHRSTDRVERKAKRSSQRPADRSVDRVVERMNSDEVAQRVVSTSRKRRPFVSTLQKAASEKEIRLDDYVNQNRNEPGEWHGFEIQKSLPNVRGSKEWLMQQPSGSRMGLVGSEPWSLDSDYAVVERQRRLQKMQQQQKRQSRQRQQDASEKHADGEQIQQRRQRHERRRQHDQNDSQRHLVENYGPLSGRRRTRNQEEARRREPDRYVLHPKRSGQRPRPYDALDREVPRIYDHGGQPFSSGDEAPTERVQRGRPISALEHNRPFQGYSSGDQLKSANQEHSDIIRKEQSHPAQKRAPLKDHNKSTFEGDQKPSQFAHHREAYSSTQDQLRLNDTDPYRGGQKKDANLLMPSYLRPVEKHSDERMVSPPSHMRPDQWSRYLSTEQTNHRDLLPRSDTTGLKQQSLLQPKKFIAPYNEKTNLNGWNSEETDRLFPSKDAEESGRPSKAKKSPRLGEPNLKTKNHETANDYSRSYIFDNDQRQKKHELFEPTVLRMNRPVLQSGRSADSNWPDLLSEHQEASSISDGGSGKRTSTGDIAKWDFATGKRYNTYEEKVAQRCTEQRLGNASEQYEQHVLRNRDKYRAKTQQQFGGENNNEVSKSRVKVPDHQGGLSPAYVELSVIRQRKADKSPQAEQTNSGSDRVADVASRWAEVSASTPAREDDNMPPVNIAAIKSQLYPTSTTSKASSRSELEEIAGRTERLVADIQAETFAGPTYTAEPASVNNLEQQDNDVCLVNYVSYRDGNKYRRSQINDPLSELEQAYDKLQLHDEDHLLPRVDRSEINDDGMASIKRLSISNVRKLEEMQSRIGDAGLEYAKQWLSTEQPSQMSISVDPVTQQVLLRSSSLPRKVADDMAYRRTRPRPNRSALSRHAYSSTSSTPAPSVSGSMKQLVSPRSRTPEIFADDLAVRTMQDRSRASSPGGSTDKAMQAAPSPTSADYLLERTTPAARGRMRVKPESRPDVSHDDMAYRRLRQDVPPVTAELPPAYYRHKLETQEPRGRSLDQSERQLSHSSSELRVASNRKNSLSDGVAKIIELMGTRGQQVNSVPDLSDETVFSKHYNSQGELLSVSTQQQQQQQLQQMQQQQHQHTPRGVKQRNEMKRQVHDSNADSGCVDDSPSSSCSDPQRSPRETEQSNVRQVHIEIADRPGVTTAASRETLLAANRRERELKAAKAKAVRIAWLKADPAANVQTDSVKQGRVPTPTKATIVSDVDDANNRSQKVRQIEVTKTRSDITDDDDNRAKPFCRPGGILDNGASRRSPRVRQIEVTQTSSNWQPPLGSTVKVTNVSHRRQHSSDSLDAASSQDSWRPQRLAAVDLSDGEMTDATDITLDAMVRRNMRPLSCEPREAEYSSRMVSHRTTYTATQREFTQQQQTSSKEVVEEDLSFNDLVSSFEKQALPFLRPPRVEAGRQQVSGRPHSWTHQ